MVDEWWNWGHGVFLFVVDCGNAVRNGCSAIVDECFRAKGGGGAANLRDVYEDNETSLARRREKIKQRKCAEEFQKVS